MNETMPNNATAPMNAAPSGAPHAHRWIWITLVIVVIAALIAGGFWYYQNKLNATQFTKATSGSLVSGFPTAFVMEQNAAVTQSYSISYQGGATQEFVADYDSAQSVIDNISAFRVYLVTNGWDLLQPGISTEVPAVILATKGSDQVTVNLQSLLGGKTEVSVVYLVNR